MSDEVESIELEKPADKGLIVLQAKLHLSCSGESDEA